MTKKSIRVEIDPTLHQKVKFKALIQKITIADLIREKLRAYVEDEKPIVLPPANQPNK